MARNEEHWPCPKCDKGDIKVSVVPKLVSKRNTYYGAENKVSREQFTVLNDCPECGATSNEITQTIRKGENKKVDHEKARENILKLMQQIKKK